jgi:hypothetical protein
MRLEKPVTGEGSMPFKSKAQARMFYAKEAKGEIPKGTSKEWSEDTNFKALPEHVKKASLNKAFSKIAEALVVNPPVRPETVKVESLQAVKQDKTKGLSPSEYRRDLTQKRTGMINRHQHTRPAR